ncbi:MAG: hypothetical protein HXY23_13875 [Parvularculaceae bacterium]|nr:hypothetical protein [Parvularculaceae bacterium]
MRIELTPEQSRDLHEKHAAPTMSDEVKVAFRKNRDEWAAEGCLPEGLTASVLEQIESEVSRRITLLMAQIELDPASVEKAGDFMAKLASLKRAKLIREDVYERAMSVFMNNGRKGLLDRGD